MLSRSSLGAVRVGLDALRVNPLRTILSTLGVIIGVASLVAVLSLGDGMQAAVRDQIASTTDLQTVAVQPRTVEEVDGQFFPLRDPLVLGTDDLRAVAALPGAEGAGIAITGRVEMRGMSGDARRMAVVSAVATIGQALPKDSLLAGRGLAEGERAGDGAIVLLSRDLAAELAGGDHAALVGDSVRVEGRPAQVVGVLAAVRPATPDGRDFRVVAPFGFAQATLPAAPRALPMLVARAAKVEETDALRARVEGWLVTRDPQWKRRVQIQTHSKRLEQASTGILMFKLFMGAITGISLLVGGIGIMNVLLASVTERTREIGIRKAAGARGRDIQLQFLAESVAISGVGSLIGAVLGLSGAFAITATIRHFAKAPFLQASFSWSTLVVAALSACIVGLLFGTYPARRAARLSPIDAIRHE